MQRLMLQEVIPSKDRGPLAFRSPSGWCVVRSFKSTTCNRVLVKDAVSGNISPIVLVSQMK